MPVDLNVSHQSPQIECQENPLSLKHGVTTQCNADHADLHCIALHCNCNIITLAILMAFSLWDINSNVIIYKN